MNFEDHFSRLAKTYALYRPGYPDELFKYLSESCKEHELAWDCGTGNGQAALALSRYFDKVMATDASREQIEHAVKNPKVMYRVETAETVSLENSSTDIVTVAVAVHWFEFDAFYKKVKEVLKPEGVIAVWTYNKLIISPEIDSLIDKYMNEVLGGYWPERFQYVKQCYKNLPFPFKELSTPIINMKTEWTLDQLTGFLNSWSGTKNYIEQTGSHPLKQIWNDLERAWPDGNKKCTVSWPLCLRVGKA